MSEIIVEKMGRYEISEVKHACRRSLNALYSTIKLATPYKDDLNNMVTMLEGILKHAEDNTVKDTRIHNSEPIYSVWLED